MAINIVPATVLHADTISAISRQTFCDSFAHQNTEADIHKHIDEYYAVPVIQNELADYNNLFFLAYDENALAGYVKLNEQPKPESKDLNKPIELERIYAVKTAIGTGVGKALMQHCIDTAKAKGKATIWLGVWEHNQRAIDFYDRWGFGKFGEHIFVVGDDPQTDWLMKRTV